MGASTRWPSRAHVRSQVHGARCVHPLRERRGEGASARKPEALLTVADRERDPVAVSREIVELFNMRGPLIRVRGKAPFDHGWQVDPTRWPTLWEAKLDGWQHELGVPMGQRRDGLWNVALDFDDYKPGAADSKTRLFGLGLDRRTVTQCTPHGGEHYFYTSPVPIRSRPLDAEGFPGVDVKCEGGQVVFYDDWEFGFGPLDIPFAMLGGEVLAVLAGSRVSAGAKRDAPTLDDERVIALLEEHFGAHSTRWNGGYFVTTRPGKNASEGHSATIGAVAPGVVHNFSGSWNGLPAGTYDRRELCKLRGLRDPALARLQAIADRIPKRGGRIAPTLLALMTGTPPEHDWLVPGVLERGDRVLLTAGAGVGKSTLLRQLACGAALGMNPLSEAPWEIVAPPIRSLIVDLENSERQLRREFEKVRTIVGSEAFDRLAPFVHVECHTEGLVLDLDDRGHREDREWLAGTVEGTRPDLVVIGPLYKMQGGRPNDEETSRDLAKWLDRLRGEHGFALVIEAHTAKATGETRPSGSSTWLRWPEFGVYLAADGSLVHWRGQREERAWPPALTRSEASPVPGEWLWRPTVPKLGNGPNREAEYESAVELAVLRMLRGYREALTVEDICERVDRRRSAVRAAIYRLRLRQALVLVPVEREAGKGATRSCDGFVLAADWRADGDR